MSIHETTLWVEIPVKVISEYTPAEKPDYSQLSPCPGSPAEVEPLKIIIPELPKAAKDIERWVEKNSPRWLEEVHEDVERQIKDHVESIIAAQELQRKYK